MNRFKKTDTRPEVVEYKKWCAETNKSISAATTSSSMPRTGIYATLEIPVWLSCLDPEAKKIVVNVFGSEKKETRLFDTVNDACEWAKNNNIPI